MDSSKLIISESESGFTISIISSEVKEESELNISAVDSLDSFIKDYQFQHKSSIDTIDVVETVRNGDTVLHHVISMGTDGITVNGELKNNNKIKTFEFWSPDKETENHDLIELLFSLMFTHFSKLETRTYLEQLEQYFDFGLGLKKLDDNPLTYKLYGSISANETGELYDFFDSLPSDEIILIEMSNFSGMGTMFDEDFLDLSESHSKLTWVNCSKAAKDALKRSGIKRKKIK